MILNENDRDEIGLEPPQENYHENLNDDYGENCGEEGGSAQEERGEKEDREPDRRVWQDDEDKAIRILVEKHGTKTWAVIAEKLCTEYFVKGRSGKQCRERWHNHLDPDINKTGWTDEEENIMSEAHKELGNKWSEIAKRLPGRTDNHVKNHWYSFQRRHTRKEQRIVGEGGVVAPCPATYEAQPAHLRKKPKEKKDKAERKEKRIKKEKGSASSSPNADGDEMMLSGGVDSSGAGNRDSGDGEEEYEIDGVTSTLGDALKKAAAKAKPKKEKVKKEKATKAETSLTESGGSDEAGAAVVATPKVAKSKGKSKKEAAAVTAGKKETAGAQAEGARLSGHSGTAAPGLNVFMVNEWGITCDECGAMCSERSFHYAKREQDYCEDCNDKIPHKSQTVLQIKGETVIDFQLGGDNGGGGGVVGGGGEDDAVDNIIGSVSESASAVIGGDKKNKNEADREAAVDEAKETEGLEQQDADDSDGDGGERGVGGVDEGGEEAWVEGGTMPVAEPDTEEQAAELIAEEAKAFAEAEGIEAVVVEAMEVVEAVTHQHTNTPHGNLTVEAAEGGGDEDEHTNKKARK